jgi:hypothetical protein
VPERLSRAKAGRGRNAFTQQEFNPGRHSTEITMAQKGAGGNAGAVTTKGGDGARGSTGTGRGGGKSGGGSAGARTKKQETGGSQSPDRAADK